MNTQSRRVATLVIYDKVTKLDVLEAVARVCSAEVAQPGTAGAHVPLTDTSWLEVEVPKFGEDGPLAIDVVSQGLSDEALKFAAQIRDSLIRDMGWNISDEVRGE